MCYPCTQQAQSQTRTCNLPQPTRGYLGIIFKCIATTIYLGVLDESFPYEAIVYARTRIPTRTKMLSFFFGTTIYMDFKTNCFQTKPVYMYMLENVVFLE